GPPRAAARNVHGHDAAESRLRVDLAPAPGPDGLDARRRGDRRALDPADRQLRVLGQHRMKGGPPMTFDGTIAVVVFLPTSSAVLLLFPLPGGGRGRLDHRLDELAGRSVPLSDPSSMAQLA